VRKNARNHSTEALKRARALRTEPSISENVFWECIRKERLGFKFRRQVAVGPYTLDFYCPSAKVAVEIDGEQHIPEKDIARDLYFEKNGILTIRVRSLAFFEVSLFEAENALRNIRETCESRTRR
jgi:very-short-patch-repair endonuclease